MLKIAVVSAGPSLERGISLNSARSLVDHLPSDRFTVVPLYVDQEKRFFQISPSQLYSNTPSDFDFKLQTIAKELSERELISLLHSVDLVFNVIHGPFGEDGQLQAFLQEHGIPFVGPNSRVCRKVFLKHLANRALKSLGYPVLPFCVVTPETKRFPKVVGRMIVKPSSGGSSLGVYSIATQEEMKEKVRSLFGLFEDKHVLIEPFCEGVEFTVVVIESKSEGVKALPPTEIATSYEGHAIFDYRKKYLPHHETRHYTPPRFAKKVTEKIEKDAKDLFVKLGLRDMVRMDGWVMPDATVYFTDFNIACGLEQNSFLFRQAAVAGFSHQKILVSIIENACARCNLPFPEGKREIAVKKQKVFVLFGGVNAERQVSLMSGTNIWLKLLKSDKYAPTPFLLGQDNAVWELPYSFALNHTVEEIAESCRVLPSLLLEQFLDKAQKENAFVFIGLHGGIGENGVLQKMLEDKNIPFNGSKSNTSSLCMDKYLTAQTIEKAKHPDITALPKKCVCFVKHPNLKNIWDKTVEEFHTERLIIKPKDDGCSSGIVLLESAQDLEKYGQLVIEQRPSIPPFFFARQELPIEMPVKCLEFLLEPYVKTDLLMIRNKDLMIATRTGWIELTVGVVEQGGVYRSLHPSITVVAGSVLSLEEKFQGGTGVNITPPPKEALSQEQIDKIKNLIEKTAEILHLRNYARIDIFFNRMTEKMIVIEANTLPGLTPSTVLYHQAFAETPPLSPCEFLETIIGNAWQNHLQSKN